MEQDPNPAPGLLISWLYPPPSDAGEDKVEAQGRDDHGEAVPVALVERLQQGDVVIRAHNLCHDNRQLILFAINRNHSASKINRN